MARQSVDDIDAMRRNCEISWDEYALLLRSKGPNPHPEINRIMQDTAKGIRDRQGRRLDLHSKFTNCPWAIIFLTYCLESYVLTVNIVCHQTAQLFLGVVLMVRHIRPRSMAWLAYRSPGYAWQRLPSRNQETP
jgi:hypothetical protein